jgi:protein-L-isoaspartate(D-aspartate) O-methyltransferase
LQDAEDLRAMDRLADFRRVFASVVAARAESKNPAIEQVFASVPRHEFVDAGPWQLAEFGPLTSSNDPALIYQDVAMGLAPERGITTGLPSLHARCIDACTPASGERVIQIGAGAGYFTAIFAELVGGEGQVVAYEIDEALADKARENLRPWPNVEVHARSGVDVVGDAADIVYVCASVQRLPRAWVEVLREGGRLVFPLTPGPDEGGMLLVRRVGAKTAFAARFVCRARFIPCATTGDDAASARLASAFREGQHDSVRSLRLAPEMPDESTWFVGDGWWLSRRAV